MATMVDTVSVEQRLRRLDGTIADAEMRSNERTQIAMQHPAADAFDHFAATIAMRETMDFLAVLRAQKMNLLLGLAS